MDIEAFIAPIIAQRTRAGLRITAIVPDRAEPFVAYLKDKAEIRKWAERYDRRGIKYTISEDQT